MTRETIDPLEVLRQIEDEANRAKSQIAGGQATTGISSLERIRCMAQDGRRWGEVQALHSGGSS